MQPGTLPYAPINVMHYYPLYLPLATNSSKKNQCSKVQAALTTAVPSWHLNEKWRGAVSSKESSPTLAQDEN